MKKTREKIAEILICGIALSCFVGAVAQGAFKIPGVPFGIFTFVVFTIAYLCDND